MANVLITEQYLYDIADAIRDKLGVQTEYKPSEMAAAILSISDGGGELTREALYNGNLISEAGTYQLLDDYTDYDFIEFIVCSPGDVSTHREAILVSAESIKDMMDNSITYAMSQFGQCYIHFTITSSALTVTQLSSLGIIEIYGLRY